jgi:hypothetical protein
MRLPTMFGSNQHHPAPAKYRWMQPTSTSKRAPCSEATTNTLHLPTTIRRKQYHPVPVHLYDVWMQPTRPCTCMLCLEATNIIMHLPVVLDDNNTILHMPGIAG